MRFLIDENLPPAFAALARETGFEAASVREILPAARDAEILDRLSVAGEASSPATCDSRQRAAICPEPNRALQGAAASVGPAAG